MSKSTAWSWWSFRPEFACSWAFEIVEDRVFWSADKSGDLDVSALETLISVGESNDFDFLVLEVLSFLDFFFLDFSVPTGVLIRTFFANVSSCAVVTVTGSLSTGLTSWVATVVCCTSSYAVVVGSRSLSSTSSKIISCMPAERVSVLEDAFLLT